MKKMLKFSSLKTVGTSIWPGICYLLNLSNGFWNPAKKWDNCMIDNFTANSKKLWRNYMLEACWLHHNKNSMIEAAWPWRCPFQSVVKKTKSLLMNKEEKLKEYHQKLFILFSLSINLVPAKPAKRFSKSC